MTYRWMRLSPFQFVCMVVVSGAHLIGCGGSDSPKKGSSSKSDSGYYGSGSNSGSDDNGSDLGTNDLGTGGDPNASGPNSGGSGSTGAGSTDGTGGTGSDSGVGSSTGGTGSGTGTGTTGSGGSATGAGGSDAGAAGSGTNTAGSDGGATGTGSGTTGSGTTGSGSTGGSATGGSATGGSTGAGSATDGGTTGGGTTGGGTTGGSATGTGGGVPRKSATEFPATGYLLRDNIDWGWGGDRVFACHAGCTVTLITSNLAVTAAHCVERLSPGLPAIPLAVGFGAVCEDHHGGIELADVPSPLTKDTSPVMMGTTVVPRYNSIYHVTAYKKHPDFSTTTRDHDIAYLVLEKPVPNVTPAKIPKRTSVSEQIANCNSFTVDYDDKSVRSIGALCIDRADPVEEKVYVAGATGQVATCFPDTGGPLYSDDITLLGVLQDFRDCTRRGGAIYTSVFDHLDFIRVGLEAGQRALAP